MSNQERQFSILAYELFTLAKYEADSLVLHKEALCERAFSKIILLNDFSQLLNEDSNCKVFRNGLGNYSINK